MSDPRNPSEEILALETALLRPGVRSSQQQIAALLAEDFREFTASGAVCERDVCLAELPREAPRDFQIVNFQAALLSPSVVLATYHLTRDASSGHSRSLRSSIWRREDGAWRMVFHQGTPME